MPSTSAGATIATAELSQHILLARQNAELGRNADATAGYTEAIGMLGTLLIRCICMFRIYGLNRNRCADRLLGNQVLSAPGWQTLQQVC
jgi:hypothetical protein